MSYAITLYAPVKISTVGALGNYTAQMRNWRDVTRATGGYWSASADFWQGPADRFVSLDEALEMFASGMQRRVIRSVGSVTMWEGFIHSMTLTNGGRQKVRTFMNAANAVKGIYSRMGGNMVNNGSAEKGAIDYLAVPASGTPNISVSTAWSSAGTHSWYVDLTPCSAGGGGIALTCTGSLVAGRTYLLSCAINIVEAGVTIGNEIHVRVGGVNIYSLTTPTGEMGVHFVSGTFEAGASGTPTIRILADSDAEFHVDDVKLYEAGTRCDTGWYTDDASIAAFGRIEEVILEAGSTDDAAIAKVQRHLLEKSWMWPTPPESDVISVEMPSTTRDGLNIEFAGYVQTLPWRNVATYGGVDEAGINISNLLADAEFVEAGDIDTNTLSVYVEQGEDVRVWNEIEKIIKSGGSGGTPWIGGVYAGRKFNYVARPTTIAYYIRNGRWYTANGNFVEPELVQPGYVLDEDLPLLPGTSQGDVRDDVRCYWMDEVEFVAPDRVNPRYSER